MLVLVHLRSLLLLNLQELSAVSEVLIQLSYTVYVEHFLIGLTFRAIIA